ncbi:MAG: ATP-binding cassette domain-containing protein [Cyanobacteria bacterium J06648_11]
MLRFLMAAAPIQVLETSRSHLTVTGLGRKLGDRWLWQALEFALPPHARLGLVGASGSGKTLLLRTLAGLDVVERGVVALDGRPLGQWSLPSYRTRVLYVSQQAALWEGTVEDNLQAVFQLSVHHHRRFDRDRILSALAAFGRDREFLARSAGQLSGGERQIVSLLRALQLDPQVLLLDEPTASLDPAATRAAEALVDRWMKAKGDRACMWTSHDREQLERVTNRLLFLKEFQA